MFEGNGVDAESVVAHARRDKALVENLWRPDVLRLVCVARLEPVKHLENLIDAVALAKSRGFVVHCIIAGKGPLECSLNATIVQRGLEDIISIVYTPAIHALIAQADVAVLTSAKEGIPRGLMEAMALSKPVVATNVLGTQELVVHRQTGLLVPFGDADAFCAALVELIDAPSLRDRLGEAGRKRIETHFNDEHIVATWTDAYKTLLMPQGSARESLVG
jgi:glycosyltransferase involved in cell wall biosynthesis